MLHKIVISGAIILLSVTQSPRALNATDLDHPTTAKNDLQDVQEERIEEQRINASTNSLQSDNDQDSGDPHGNQFCLDVDADEDGF